MKVTVPIVALAWALSLVAAYLAGSRSGPSAQRPPGADDPEAAQGPSVPGKSLTRGDRSASRPVARGTAGRILAEQPPREAVVALARLSDPIARTEGFLALLDGLRADQFRDVVADFRALGITEQRMSEYGMLLHAWALADPLDALDYAMKNTGTPFARQTILASWAADDPEAALAFARQNHGGEGANPLLVGVIRGVAGRDLARATDLLEELPYSRERGEALRSVLPFVTRDGIDTALQWSNRIADERLRSGAVSFILSDLSDSQPGEAARLLVDLDDQAVAARVADQVAGSLARSDLELALNWAGGLQGDLRAEAAEGIISHYASRDPQAAGAWLDSLAGSTNLDPAIRSFAWATHRSEPALAAEWIGQVRDDGARAELYRNILTPTEGSIT